MLNDIKRLFILLILVLFSGISQGQVTSVTTNPASKNIAINTNVFVTITWKVARSDPQQAGNQAVTVTSTAGYLQGAQTESLYLTVNRTLTQTKVVSGTTTYYYLTETIAIPSSIIYQALRNGDRGFLFNRLFSDGQSSRSRDVILNITGGSGALLSLTRVSLRFDNGSVERVVRPATAMTVRAQVGFTGTGRLAGVWEVAWPGTSATQPIYQPLALVRLNLAGGQTVIQSPRLPTTISGLYRIRLRLTDPALPEDRLPVLRYFVFGRYGEGLPGNIRLVSPISPSAVGRGTVFQWHPVSGAHAYRLEIFPMPRAIVTDSGKLDKARVSRVPEAGAERVAGAVVRAGKGTTPGLTLGDTTILSRLRAGQRYLWRVLALDGKGRVIAVSTFGEIRRN